MSGYVTVSGYKAQYNITSVDDDATLALMIEAISDAIDAECNREGRLWNRSVVETMDMISGGSFDVIGDNQFSSVGSSSGKNNLNAVRGTKYHTKNTPITAVTKVESRDDDVWTVDTKNVYAYPEYVAFDSPYNTNKRLAVRFTLTVGFFAPEIVPSDLKMITNQLVRDEMSKIKNNISSYFKSKRIGGTSHGYDLAGNGQFGSGSAVFESVIAKYRKSIIYGNI